MLCNQKQTGPGDFEIFYPELEEFLRRDENKIWGETFCKELCNIELSKVQLNNP